MNEEEERLALCRYGVIAPLISRQLNKREAEQVRREILEGLHSFPQGYIKVSERSLRRWVSIYREAVKEGRNGLHALARQKRSDTGSPRQVHPEVLAAAALLKKELPSRSLKTISAMLDGKVNPVTLGRHFRDMGLDNRSLKRTGKAYPPHERKRRNEMWQADFSDAVYLPDPCNPQKVRKCYLHLFIDDYSRYVPYGAFYFRENMPVMEDCFRKALLLGGVPSTVYWDNGSVYRAKQLQRIMARLGVEVIYSRPFMPRGKGKVERAFKTIKEAFYPEARHADITTLAELNEFFHAWLNERYHKVVHSSTKQTPLERWQAGAEQVRWIEADKVAEIFLWEEERTVTSGGCVKLSGNAYPVEEYLVGQKVTVLFDPFDLTSIKIHHKEQFVMTSRPDQVVQRSWKGRREADQHPLPLRSSQQYKNKLVAAHQQGDYKMAAAATLDVASLQALVERYLCRNLSTIEQETLKRFFSTYAPLRGDIARQALEIAVSQKGLKMHISAYLDRIKSLHHTGGQ